MSKASPPSPINAFLNNINAIVGFTSVCLGIPLSIVGLYENSRRTITTNFLNNYTENIPDIVVQTASYIDQMPVSEKLSVGPLLCGVGSLLLSLRKYKND